MWMVLKQHEAGESGTLVSMAHDLNPIQLSNTTEGLSFTTISGLLDSASTVGYGGNKNNVSDSSTLGPEIELSPAWKRY